MTEKKRVVIVGGGASGVLTALALLRKKQTNSL
jgi:glycine/D-amino acid oxidase-like deaminating enzyme